MFSDEKWYHLTQHPNRQNVRYWSVTNPDFIKDYKDQSVAKIMAFVLVIDGCVLPVIWHIDEQGKSVCVNTDRYIDVIKRDVLPFLPENHWYWWQQDGATSHTAKKARDFLREEFGGRLISRFEPIEWPSRSPDLNPLDYCFWGMSMAKVYKAQPKTIPELVNIVEEFFESLSEDFIRKSVDHIKKRAELCIKYKGAHFEHKL